ncbi:conserved exported hypothetical protein [Gammaproteobacteria bacterium]
MSRILPLRRVVGVLILQSLLIWETGSTAAATVEEPVAAAMPIVPSSAEQHWLVWYGNDNKVHRQQVDGNAYAELRQSLRQVREEDLHRLKNLANDYLRIDLESIFTDLDARRESFLLTLFDFGTSSSLLGTALTAAGQALKSNAENAEAALEQVREATAKEVVNQFRTHLIAPQTMLRALRAAAGRSLGLLKQDLLQDCDRYDRAFRGFVLESTATMETLDVMTGWQVDISWRPETATFRSLCAGLRHVDPGIYLVESSLAESFVNAEPSMYNEALELVLPIAKTSLELNNYTENASTSLGAWGIPKNWANPPATVVSYIAHTQILARRVGERLDVRRKRPRLRVTLQKTLDELQVDLVERLRRTCDEFITTELDRIELGLAARGEGVWSMP